MKSHLVPSFRDDFERLPENIQRRARAAYRRFLADPLHPGLQFKRLATNAEWWSVRVIGSYRAVGVRPNTDTIIWFFIGTHA